MHERHAPHRHPRAAGPTAPAASTARGPRPARDRARAHRRGAAVVTAVVGAVLGVACALPATAAAEPAAARGDHRATQEAIDAVVARGVPGVVAGASDGRATWAGRSGTADLRSGLPRQADERFRVGSITKTFTATVLLQLVAEDRLSLDDTVHHWLPDLVRGNGHDGERITVRQLLNHTSGVYSYTDDADVKRRLFGTDFLRHRYDTWAPRDIVGIAMTHRPDFEPGTGWHYSDTNYVLAAMVIEEVTGRPYAREVERRILRPLDLRATSLPGTDARMPAPSARAYSKLTGTLGAPGEPGSPTYDVTSLNPTLAGAAGEVISSTRDLNRFYRALLSGKLLAPDQLREMTTTVPIAGTKFSYGLGLMKQQTSCGVVWGHNGAIQGSLSTSLTTADGEHALSVNVNGDWAGAYNEVVEAEFCAK
ncbi:serine hydrolase domain-containing protein [Streptomyces buecherae]|uniref:serine hydrolase domain-containing protein n=1 Tax=Streptomyces buecherae TaxID=2763006 RepID=UPI0036A85716